MSREITLTIPDDVYRRAEHIAQLKRQDVAALLAEALAESAVLAETAVANGEGDADEWDAAVAREKAAYLAMHPLLWEKYPGQHVAIHNSQLIDRDKDGAALSRRIYDKYPDQFVLIRQVEVEPDRILQFRSPRFAGGLDAIQL
jgi:predicted transcriptional regulator